MADKSSSKDCLFHLIELVYLGAVGSKGNQGVTGITGTAGANGINGINGINGAKGDLGAAGVAGTNGTPGTVSFSYFRRVGLKTLAGQDANRCLLLRFIRTVLQVPKARLETRVSLEPKVSRA